MIMVKSRSISLNSVVDNEDYEAAKDNREKDRPNTEKIPKAMMLGALLMKMKMLQTKVKERAMLKRKQDKLT